MKTKDFKKILKEKNSQEIIYMHCFEKIYLTSKQLDLVIERKNRNGETNERVKRINAL